MLFRKHLLSQPILERGNDILTYYEKGKKVENHCHREHFGTFDLNFRSQNYEPFCTFLFLVQ